MHRVLKTEQWNPERSTPQAARPVNMFSTPSWQRTWQPRSRRGPREGVGSLDDPGGPTFLRQVLAVGFPSPALVRGGHDDRMARETQCGCSQREERALSRTPQGNILPLKLMVLCCSSSRNRMRNAAGPVLHVGHSVSHAGLPGIREGKCWGKVTLGETEQLLRTATGRAGPR